MPYDNDGNYTPHAPYTIEKTYKLMGKYNGQTEEIESDIKDMDDANYLLAEYQMAYGNNWEIWIEEE